MSQRKKTGSLAMAFSPPHKKVKMDASQSSTPLAGSTPVRKSSLAFGGRTSSFVKPHRRDKESTFNDPIHGSITMQGLCLSIIDTKEFQRLRKLMQLGTCSYVFYGATHTRFEHSIGVSHFAGMVARNLQTSQPYLGITEEDILCVKVAGLCHDLGHGPFSHVFDGVFIPRIVPNTSWRHEDGSVQMLKYLLGKNRIDHREYGLNDRDLLFIEEIIAGTKEADRRGRGYEKFYLYDIVNNSRSGLDVDKLDYFMRDMRYTNASSSTCNFQRFIELGRVFPADPIQHTALRLSTGSTGALGEEEPEREHYMICYPEKMVKEALDVFAVRFRLHQTIYTHKSVKKVEFMITDALVLANDVIRIPGQATAAHPDGLYRMSECVEDPEALSNLNDQVLTVIELSADPRLKEAQALLRKVQNRQFYTCLGKTTYTRQSKLHRATDEQIEEMIIQCSAELAAQRLQQQLHSRSQSILAQPHRIDSADLAGIAGIAPASPVRTTGMNVDDPFNDIVASPDSWRYIQSQDSLAGDYFLGSELSRDANSNLAAMEGSYPTLQKGDIIVDRIHIHYGKKHQNPVENMRFYAKGGGAEQTARQVPEDVYQTLLPRTFEELAVRVFCRDARKEHIAAKAFSRFCSTCNTHLPFPSQSQSEEYALEDEEVAQEVRQFAHITASSLGRG